MAGKHIYIETILDNLLGGFQTTFDKMIAALDRMIGKTEEDPEGTSLKNVVSSVESLMGENQNKKNLFDVVDNLETMTDKLNDQIDELQNLVAASSAAITKLIVVKGNTTTQPINFGTGVVSSQTTTQKDFNVLSNASGTLTFAGTIHFSNIVKISSGMHFKISKIVNGTETIIKDINYIKQDQNIEFDLTVKQGDQLVIRLWSEYAASDVNTKVELKFNNLKFHIVNLISEGALDINPAS